MTLTKHQRQDPDGYVMDVRSGFRVRDAAGQALRPPLPVYRCTLCGAETTRVVLAGAVTQTRPEWLWFEASQAVCEACEEQRILAQARRIRDNEQVLPHLREAAVAFLERHGEA
jgi:hypothetical protein